MLQPSRLGSKLEHGFLYGEMPEAGTGSQELRHLHLVRWESGDHLLGQGSGDHLLVSALVVKSGEAGAGTRGGQVEEDRGQVDIMEHQVGQVGELAQER